MNFKMIHENYNVQDLDKSLAFYEKALGLTSFMKKWDAFAMRILIWESISFKTLTAIGWR